MAGVVYDESGAVVEGAKITTENFTTGRTRVTSTNQAGQFRVVSMEVGEYSVTVSKDGFRVSAREGLTLELDKETVVEITLTLGEQSESVVVTGKAILTEAAPSALTSVVDSNTIEQLPLNGRDYIQLATLQAGAPVARASARDVNMGYGVQISISGSRPYQNGFQLDGVNVVSYNGSTPGSINGVNLGVDAVEEFSVHSSTFSAQYGRAAGGLINAVTKSGGNEPHGSLFYFHRYDNLDARNFFDREAPPEFRRHQFGGSIGGAIAHNRTFFFTNYEGLRQARGNTTINSTLSAEARRGNLVGQSVAVDPVMAKVAALYPLPNAEVFGISGQSETRVAGTDDPDLAFLPGGAVIGLVNVSGVTELPGGSGALDTDIHVFNSFQPSADLTVMRGRTRSRPASDSSAPSSTATARIEPAATTASAPSPTS